jgi:hypothetical protein
MRVPNGSYLFRVGTYEFPLAATGGFQTWEVDEANEAAQAAGEHLTYDGIGSLLGGGILIAAELGREGGSETSPTAIIGYSILGLGAVSLLIGAPLWALCGGSAELISAEPLDEPGTGDAGAATAFALIPGPVAFDPWSGRSAWGLTLALRL